MLAKKQRLSREQFSEFFKSGKRFNTPKSTLIYTPSKNFHGAVVVSKKVHKQAVKRNLFRRRVYSQLYRVLHKNQTGVFIVVLKSGFNKLSKNQQHLEIKKLIELVK